ncbi:unnamed protein product [marine sediment metagenome]|uniref:Uncharacterized protein n=1 Tax=marine sediment metagenome TaxID=412755 RepID=X1DHJ4_9ZZZZ
MVTNFKARLVEIPKALKEKESKDLIDLGKFTLNKRYKVYTVYAEKLFTDFLVADDTGVFYWINMSVFRE